MKHGQLKKMIQKLCQKPEQNQQQKKAQQEQHGMNDALHQRTHRSPGGVARFFLPIPEKAFALLRLCEPFAESRLGSAVRRVRDSAVHRRVRRHAEPRGHLLLDFGQHQLRDRLCEPAGSDCRADDRGDQHDKAHQALEQSPLCSDEKAQ